MSRKRKRKLFSGLVLLGLMLVVQSCIYGESKECGIFVCDVDMACSPSRQICIPQGCGDGEIADGEDCDASGEETAECNINCKKPSCGDNVINRAAGEECEPGVPGGESCTDLCKWEPQPKLCGNGYRDPGEVCDDENTITETECPYGQQTCTKCNADCSEQLNLTGPYCGDGIINGPDEAEQCDLKDMPEFCIVGIYKCRYADPHDEKGSQIEKFSEFRTTEDIVVDSKNDLVWQRKYDNKRRTWDHARDYCIDLKLAGCKGGWRLPTKWELESLVDKNQSEKPYINKVAFPDVVNTAYWTSTEKEGDSGSAWAISFSNGNSFWNSQAYHNYVRCVR